MKKTYLLISGVVLIIILALGGGLFWTYRQPLNDNKAKVFRSLHLPVAFVGTKAIPMTEILKRFDLAKSLLGSRQDVSDNEIKSQILARLISDEQANKISKGINVSLTNKDIEDRYAQVVKQVGGGNETQFVELIKKNYGMNVDEFKTNVLSPDILQGKIQLWFNSQKNLNELKYKRLDEILAKLSSGQDLGELAKAESDDEATKSLKGDSGFIPIQDMLPEFQVSLGSAAVGETKTVVSRYGIHIVKVLEKDTNEKDGNRVHVQQIYIKIDGFQKWYDDKAKAIKITNLISFK